MFTRRDQTTYQDDSFFSCPSCLSWFSSYRLSLYKLRFPSRNLNFLVFGSSNSAEFAKLPPICEPISIREFLIVKPRLLWACSWDHHQSQPPRKGGWPSSVWFCAPWEFGLA